MKNKLTKRGRGRGHVTYSSHFGTLLISLERLRIQTKNFACTLIVTDTERKNEQDAQLSQRDRAAGFVTVFTKSRRLELGDNILRTI